MPSAPTTERPVPNTNDVVFLSGVGHSTENLLERKAPVRPRILVLFVAIVVGLIVVVVSIFGGSDDVLEGEDALSGPTEEAAATPELDPEVPTRETLPFVDSELAVGVVAGDLPGARPAARLVALSLTDVVTVDLETGSADRQVTGSDRSAATLLGVGDQMLVFDRGRVTRLDPSTGTELELASGVTSISTAYEPAGVVTVTRDQLGLAVRIIGTDGILRAGIRASSEAVVHGAVDDRLVISAGGLVRAVPNQGEPIEVGSGRVVAVGEDLIVRVTCETVASCVMSSGGVADPERWSVALPEIVAGVVPELWNEPGQVSPDGTRVALHLAQAAGTTQGVLVIDLETGDWVHSPEVSAGLGSFAWALDSRFIAYSLDGDVMFWNTRSGEGVLPSARMRMSSPISSVWLQP